MSAKMIVKINPEDILDIDPQKFCCLPYQGHPKGCPNYGKKKGCPPNSHKVDEILDFKKDIFLIYTEFKIGEYAEKIRKIHPNWSNRQIYCCLYWQRRARKFQREEEQKCKKEKDINLLLTCPEANGVNVNLLMNRIGVKLEWPPRKITRLVSLGGMNK